jgi:UDP-N-acetylmuramoyl-tripeptide--D-alanyl-D-alanine ligase
MRALFQQCIQSLAQMYLRRYRPTIIAVTGNVGKTSTKEAIACVLKRHYRIRMSGGNLNNELGVPLSILGDWAGEYYAHGSSGWFWLKVAVLGVLGLIWSPGYPRVLVLEYGADKPGDIKRLAQLFKPHISVVTAVGETPVHVEFFASPEALAQEKAQLVKVLTGTDYAVLNADDEAVLNMKEKTKASVTTFGFADHADIRIASFELSVNPDHWPQGIAFKLHDDMTFVPVKIHDSLGRAQALAAAAAGAVAKIMKVNLVEVSTSLKNYVGPKGRLRVLPGIKTSIILDDTYNASPSAMHVALEVLKDLPAKRKIAVLGDMLELGKYALQAHQTIGNMAGAIADVLICVGEKAAFIADAAANEMDQASIYTFHDSNEAKLKVQELIQPGDLVLIKGSQGKRMEKIVEEIIAEPQRKRELLVRQSGKWLNTP